MGYMITAARKWGGTEASPKPLAEPQNLEVKDCKAAGPGIKISSFLLPSAFVIPCRKHANMGGTKHLARFVIYTNSS